MSFDIGPKIGIDGEKEFRQQIADINTQMKTLATEMTAATSAYDKNDKSVDNLTNQNKILTQQIETQKQKLDALSQGLGSAADKYGENDKVTQGWKQAVNKATAELNNLERQLNSNNSILSKTDTEATDAENSIKDLGNSMDGAKDKASIFGDVLGGSLVAGGLEKVSEKAVEAAKSIADLALTSDASVGTLQAKLGLAKDEAVDLSAVAETVWVDGFGEDLDEAIDSVATIRQSLGKMAEDELGDVTESALTVKQVFGADVNESIKTVKTMMDNFKISADNAFDIITVGYQNGLDYSGEFLDTLNEYSPQFKSMGISAEEALKLLTQGSDNGAFSLDKVADSMKEFNIRIKDGSTTTQDGLKAIGIDYDDLMTKLGNGSITSGEAMQIVIDKLSTQKDSVKQNQAGVSLFGTQWEDLGSTAILAMGQVDTELSNSMSNIEGSTKRAGDAANDNLNSKFQTALRGIQQSIEPLAQQILDFVNGAMPKIQSSLQWISDNGSLIASAITGITTAAIGLKILSIVSGITKAWQAYKVATEGATIAQWALNAAQQANIFGVIVIAIIALIAGLVTLWNTNEGFRNAVIGAWNAIKETAVNVWNAIVKFFTQDIPNAFNIVVGFFKELPGKIGEFFANLPNLIWNGLVAANNKINEWGQGIVNWIITNVPIFLGKIGEFFMGLPGMIWNWLLSVNTKINEWGQSVINWIIENIPIYIGKIGQFFTELPGKIGYALGLAIGTVIKWGIDLVKWIIENVPVYMGKIGGFFAELPGKIWDGLVSAYNKVNEWGQNVIDWIVLNVPIYLGKIGDFFKELPSIIWDGLVAANNKINQWGQDVVDWIVANVPIYMGKIGNYFKELPGKIWDGLVSAIGKIKTWGYDIGVWAGENLPGLMTQIGDFFKELPGKLFDVGVDMIKGLWNGIKSLGKWIADRLKEFAGGLTQGIKDALGIQSPSRVMRDQVGKMIGLGVVEGINSTQNKVSQAMSALSKQVNMDGNINVGSSVNGLTGSNSLGSKMSNLTLNIPLSLDGKTISNVVGKIQFDSNGMKGRGTSLA